MSWMYLDEPLEYMPEVCVSFVYKIEIAGYIYIGMKGTKRTVTKLALKSGDIRDGATRVYKNVAIGEDGKVILSKKDKALARKRGLKAKRTAFDTWKESSSWKMYCSSSDEVKKLVEEGNEPTRTILRMCRSLREASFYENKYLYEIFGNRNCLNMNLSGNYFLEDIQKWREM